MMTLFKKETFQQNNVVRYEDAMKPFFSLFHDVFSGPFFGQWDSDLCCFLVLKLKTKAGFLI